MHVLVVLCRFGALIPSVFQQIDIEETMLPGHKVGIRMFGVTEVS